MSQIPSGKKCMVVGCSEMVKARDLCATHYARSRRRGFAENFMEPAPRAVQPPRFCEVEGCEREHVADGLCDMHYRRVRRHGDVIQTRPADWGAREKHPLYVSWNWQMRRKDASVCERWRDFWAFVQDIGDSRPSKKHRLAPINEDAPLGPGNVYWREPRVGRNTAEERVQRNVYAKNWRAANQRKAVSSSLKKLYGIGIDDYERMFDAQGGVCAICLQEERRVDHRTKAVSRLAVDHNHETNAIRSLLCHGCNNSLGASGDDPVKITAMVAYLAKHSADPSAVLMAAISKLQAALPPAATA